jgi:exopolyphosphatase/guanosine-5'-triphosphate,3'-diphosphate pyrophosphatase
VAVGTGGTLTVARTIAALKVGATTSLGSSLLPIAELTTQFDSLKVMPLTERQRFPGLPPARADVYPTALATYLAVARLGHFDSYRHSLYNLRYGLAREALAASN